MSHRLELTQGHAVRRVAVEETQTVAKSGQLRVGVLLGYILKCRRAFPADVEHIKLLSTRWGDEQQTFAKVDRGLTPERRSLVHRRS